MWNAKADGKVADVRNGVAIKNTEISERRRHLTKRLWRLRHTVPLCRGHHREVHRCGDEAAWWRKAGIDPTEIAHALRLETHPLLSRDDVPADVAESSIPGATLPT
jgi:hypothetical protein